MNVKQIGLLPCMAIVLCTGMLFALCANIAYAETYEIAVLSAALQNQNPNPAVAGGVLDVSISILNNGSTSAQNIVIGPEYKYPFVQLAGEPTNKTILLLPPYPSKESTTIVTFRVGIDPNAIEGSYGLSLIRLSGPDVVWKAGTNVLTIKVTNQEFAEIDIDKTSLDRGKEANMTFTVTNKGNAPLRNIMFSWIEDTGVILPVGMDNVKYIKSLDVGESIALTYGVIASINADPDLYKLKLTLQYNILDASGNTTTKTISRYAGITVGGGTDFDVTFSESSAGQTSLSIANIGNNPALSVTVRVPNQEAFRVSGSTASILGNLDAGDYTIVSFQIESATGRSRSGNFSGPQPNFTGRPQMNTNFTGRQAPGILKVIIEYTDTTGKRQSVEKSVDIQFRGTSSTAAAFGNLRQQAANEGLPWYYIAVGAVTILAVVFFVYKKIKTK